MRTNTERLLDNLSALRALLRGEARVHSDHTMSSVCSFGTENVEECTPTGVQNALREMMIFHHSGESQVFNDNALIAFCIRLGCFKMVVAPLTDDFEMGFRYVLRSFPTPPTPFLAPTHLALLPSECALRRAIETRILNSIPIRVRQKRFQTNINPNSRMFALRWFVGRVWFLLANDQGIPMPVSTQHHMDGFRGPLKRTMQLNFERLAQLGRDDQMFLVFVHVTIFTVLPQLNRMPTGWLLKTGKPDTGNSVLFSSKKTFERFGKAISEHLDCSSWDMLTATSFKYRFKFIRRRNAFFTPIVEAKGTQRRTSVESTRSQPFRSVMRPKE